MKNLLAIAMIVAFSAITISCDGLKTSPPSTPAPVNMGSGTLLIFATKDSAGNYTFNETLSAYFQEHRDMRFAGMMAIEHDNSATPVATKYIVVAEKLDVPVPPQPTTLPTVNGKGEIQYPGTP
jgi:hypothetical protein